MRHNVHRFKDMAEHHTPYLACNYIVDANVPVLPGLGRTDNKSRLFRSGSSLPRPEQKGNRVNIGKSWISLTDTTEETQYASPF